MADKDSSHHHYFHHHEEQQKQPAQQAQPQHKSEPEHHHGKDFAKKVGNAVIFGAGATAGSDAVNAFVKR